MCKNHNKQNVDKCMKNLVKFINEETRFQTIMCCCGHGKYPPSLMVIDSRVAKFCNAPTDIFSGFQFKHGRRRFYKRDEGGYYFIPEVNQSKQEICECGHTQWDEHKCTFDPMVAQECNVKGCKCKKFKLRKLEVNTKSEVSSYSKI